MKCIIPCAGYATRLFPLTLHQPKALLDVQGKPILEHIVAKIQGLPAASEIIIVTNNKFYPHFKIWFEQFQSKLPLKLLNDGTNSEQERLGQVGDIRFVIEKEKIDDDLLVIAGDNLFNFSLQNIHSFFSSKQEVVNGLYDAKSLKVAREQGNASLDSEGKIFQFEEKPSHPVSTLISLGIYLFPRLKVKLISQYLDQGKNPDKMGYFMMWMIEHNKVYGFVYQQKWFDIGWQESLELARRQFNH